jgi:hypothetical protein
MTGAEVYVEMIHHSGITMIKINYIITPEHATQLLEAGRRTAIADLKNGIDSSKARCPYRRDTNKEMLWVTGYLSYLSEVSSHAA